MAVNPAYIGLTYFGKTCGSRKTILEKQPEANWRLLLDTTPPIIEKEMFERVQQIRDMDRGLHRAKAKHQYLLRGHVFCGYCGSPLVGSFLNRRFRYYHCRGTYPTATREKICHARYIRADYLEDNVWVKVREVLENPAIVLASIKEQLEIGKGCQAESLDKEILKLKRRMKSYDLQEKRLVQLFRYAELDQNNVLDEISRLKKERERDKELLEDYLGTRERIATLKQAEIGLAAYCEQLKSNLDAAPFEDRRDILDMLAIKVSATPESLEINGVIPLELAEIKTTDEQPYLLTTGQTSA